MQSTSVSKGAMHPDKASLLDPVYVAAFGGQPVYFYLPTFAGGGAERVYVRLANHYAALGLDTQFIVNVERGPLRPLLSDKVHLHVLHARSAARALPKLARLMMRHKPRVLLSALTRANITAMLARTLSGSSTRMVLSERNHVSTLISAWHPLRRHGIEALIRATYRHAHAVTAVAGGVAEDIEHLGRLARDTVRVIHNPSPEQAEIDAAHASDLPHPWFAEDIPVLIAAGRLLPQKDYPTMLEAVRLVDAKRPVRLIVLGDGPQFQEMQDLARQLGLGEKVHFAGFRMNRFDYMARGGVLLLSSITEGFPNVVVEALACGCAVVSTDCAGNGPREILGGTYPNALVPVRNAAQMAEAVLYHLENRRPRADFEGVAARFAIDSVAKRYAEAARP